MAGRVHVVTRNAHVEDIRTFLAARGLGGLPVHRVGRPLSKSEVVCDPALMAEWTAGFTEGEGGDAVVVFVDDTPSELLDEEIRQAPHVVRFLFARSR